MSDWKDWFFGICIAFIFIACLAIQGLLIIPIEGLKALNNLFGYVIVAIVLIGIFYKVNKPSKKKKRY